MQAQTLDALGDCEFEGHRTHVLSATAPVDAENLLAAQSEHVPVPVTVLYFPPAHAMHVPPFSPVYPASHEHWVKTVLSCAELEPAGQAVHNAVPVTALYFPARHAEHVPPSGPVNPRLHLQYVMRLAIVSSV
jgi:hypothetical protein